MTALDTFGASLLSGEFAEFTTSNITNKYDGSSAIFEPSAVALADGQLNGYSTVHMADWWSHIPHDPVTDTYWIAGGRDRQRHLPQNLVSYSAVDNLWTQRAGWSGNTGGHCYQGTAVGGGKVYYLGGGGIQVWDIASDSYAGSLPGAPSNVCPPYTSGLAAGAGLAYLPWMGNQGSLLMVNTNGSSTLSKSLSRVARLDLETVSWSPVFAAKGVWQNQHTLALPSKHGDFAWIGASTATLSRPLGILDSTGTVEFVAAGPVNACTGGSNSSRGMVFEHPDRPELISFSLADSKIWSLPYGGTSWVERGTVPSVLVNGNSVAMPTRFGAAFARYQSASRSKMYAWKPDF